MLELFGGGILGSLLGGVFRLAPELLKWLDKKGERAHELEMFKNQIELEKSRGEIKLQEINAQRNLGVDTGVLAAFKSAIDQQTEITKVAGGWPAKVSACIRPVLTIWVWLLYSFAFLTLLWVTWGVLRDPAQIARLVLTGDFMALLSGMTNYWFLDRTLKQRGL